MVAAIRKLTGTLIIVAVLTPVLTLAVSLPLTTRGLNTFQALFVFQVWTIHAARVVFAYAAFAIARLVSDRPARIFLCVAGSLYAWLAVDGALRALGITFPLAMAADGLAYLAALSLAVGLWRSAILPRWVPLLMAGGVLFTVTSSLLIPESVIDASARAQMNADFAFNPWLLPSTLGMLAISLAWLAVGILLRRSAPSVTAAA